ncbi:MAG: hypothetical protein NTV87_16600 [Ignavibacteriae bacterium]|nr:hypothetical protein [Ignavibacteriota bacterium]
MTKELKNKSKRSYTEVTEKTELHREELFENKSKSKRSYTEVTDLPAAGRGSTEFH